jgi:hypothetical protein
VLVTALNSAPVIFYPTDTFAELRLLFRTAIMHRAARLYTAARGDGCQPKKSRCLKRVLELTFCTILHP